MKRVEAASAEELRTVPVKHPTPFDGTSRRRLACGEVVVILELLSGDEFIVIGCLVEIDAGHIVFDYLVMDKTLEDRLGAAGSVLLKKNGDRFITLTQIPCVVISDVNNSESSFSGLPIRRCVLRPGVL